MKELIHKHEYFLTAAECDAQGRMPMTLLVERIIETATEHANKLGIGYADLQKHNIGWVLSRLSIELDERPGVNTRYELSTYINDLNRLYSTRTHELSIIDSEGNRRHAAYVRTVWVAIDTSTRSAADLGVINAADCVRPDAPCPVSALRRLVPQGDTYYSARYSFRFTDIDINGHVNSVRYLDSILECRPMQWHAVHDIMRFDIIYHHECLWHQCVDITAVADDALTDVIRLERQGETVVTSRVQWK